MCRAIRNYKITKRKDGRYYVRLQDAGEITHIYGKQMQSFRQSW